MSTDNNMGVQTRAMTEAQHIENEANPEHMQGTPNPATNPTVDLHKAREKPSRHLYDNKAPFPLIGMYQTSTTLE